VEATGDVQVASIALEIDGVPITLDQNNGTFFTPTSPGLPAIVGTAIDTSGNVGTAGPNPPLRVLDPNDTEPPFVEITSPAPQSVVTYLTDIIGSVTDDNLEFYRLEISPRNANQWRLIEEVVFQPGPAGPGVINQTLGVFDPTLLSNTIYDVRVFAQDTNGLQTTRQIQLSVEANAKIGNFVQSVTDLMIPVAGGPPIDVARTYNTLNADESGAFGYGWQYCMLEPRIRETVPFGQFEGLVGQFAAAALREGDRVYITTPDCQRVGFTFSPQPHTGIWTLVSGEFFDPRWIPDPGVDYELYGEHDYTLITGIGSGIFDRDGLPLPLVRLGDGSYITAQLGASYNPLGYQLFSKDKTRWHYSQFDGLLDVTDRNGNTLTVSEGGITSSSGQQVQFQRDDQRRITRLIDPAGNEIHYSYNAAGELQNVKYPNGLNSDYAYNAGPEHYLSAINADDHPQADTARLDVVYDVAGRLAAVINALGHTTNIAYDLDANTERTVDPLGFSTITEYDQRGNIVRETDPLGGEVSFTYDADDNLTSITDERGFTTQLSYDSNSNLTNVIDPLGFTTTSAYNSHNDITTQTDASGNTHEYVYDARGNLVEIRAPLGAIATITYDVQGRPVTVTNANGSITNYEYGSGPNPNRLVHPDGTSQHITYNRFGQITSLTDENGHTTRFNYDSQGRTLDITDPLGQQVTFRYAGRFLESITNKRGTSTHYLYDSQGRLIRVTDPLGGIQSFTYDAIGQKLSETDQLGHTFGYTYSPKRHLTSVTDPLGAVTSYEYDPAGNQAASIDAKGRRSEMTYDARSQLLTHTDPLRNTWSYTFDALRMRTSVTDPRGNTSAFEYDALQRLERIVDPLGNATSYAYDLQGNLLSVTDPLGRTTSFAYDARNRPIEQTDALGGVRAFGYDPASNRTSITDELGRVTSFAYDALNRLISSTDPAGATWNYAYNEIGQRTSSIDPTGAVVQFIYDSLNRLTSMTDAGGGIHSFTYDAVGNRTSSTNPLGRISSFAYDALDRLASATDPRGTLTQFQYDALSNRISVTDGNGNLTQFVYDDGDRLIQRIDPLGHLASFNYDPNGNLIQTTDRNGRVRTFAYDALNRRTTETWLDGAGSPVDMFTFSYDAAGNLLTSGDNTSQYTFAYDALDRLTSSDNAGTLGLPNVVLTYGYDAVGNRTSVEDDTGVRVNSMYDSRNLLSERRWSGGGIDPARIDFVYSQRGERTEARRYADADALNLIGRSMYQYDPNGVISHMTHVDAVDAVVANYNYVRDLAQQIIEWTHQGQTTTYTHDEAAQLSSADHTTQPDESYAYDATGNRTSGDNVVGPNNQLLADDKFNYAYDSEGNLVSKTGRTSGEVTEYEYDHRNRLIRVTVRSSGGIILQESAYRYDSLDRRIGRTIDADGPGPQPIATTYTIYDGMNAWADYDDTGNIIARYLFGDRTDEIIARWRPGSGTAWYLTDHLGTVQDIVDADGSLLNRYTYDSFGQLVAMTDPSAADRFAYTGREFDNETGLFYYRARFYDPRLGRFLSQDPLGFAAGDVNLYRYVGNNPLGAADPSGRLAIVEKVVKEIFDRKLELAITAACTLGEYFAENGLVAPWNEPSKAAEAALRAVSGVSGGVLLGGGMGLAHRFILRSLTLKITASVAAGVGGLGFATYGVYDAWRSGNTTLFWVRLTCTTADFGMMVSSLWRTLARARLAQFAAEADPKDFQRLNQVDPDTARLRPGEARAAARGEIELGTMTRAEPGRGDFVITDGPNAGKTVDFKITPDDAAEAARINQYFQVNWPDFRNKLLEALNSPTKDVIAIGINSLDVNNQAMMHGLINSLPQNFVSKIVLF
jgi:RHS repeat-associated protein